MSDESLLAFTRALCDSVRSGLPPAAALRDLGQKASADAVEKGETMEAALRAQGRFPPVFLSLIRAGETSGKLDTFLDRYAASLDTRIDFGRRLRRALTYPVFAGVVGLVVFLLFTTKAVPLLLQPLMEAGATLPAGALAVMSFGQKVTENWPLIAAIAGAVLALLWAAFASPWGRKARSLCGHWLPGARYVSEEARHCELEATAGLLLGAGLRPHEVLDILSQCFEDDPLVTRRLRAAAALLPQGKTLTECLSPCLPAEDRTRFSVAETAGRLDETLAKLADSHRDRHLHRLKSAATAIQLASVTALAPACFGLILWILWPALSMLKAATALPGGEGAAAAPVSSRPLPPPDRAVVQRSAEASHFNETHAPSLLGFMQDHDAAKSEPAAEADAAAAPAKKKKKWEPAHLKSTQPIQTLRRGKTDPTTVRSAFE